jgi:hypothetical protein
MLGHVRRFRPIDWHVRDDDFANFDQQALLDRALAGHSVADTLRSCCRPIRNMPR